MRTSLCILVTSEFIAHVVGKFSGGFCLDNVPDKLKGTGFTESSNTSKAKCPSGKWCPLANDTKVWEGVTYYWFSGCCTGHQGKYVIEDEGDKGWPNCAKGMDSSKCQRMQWHHKYLHDFVHQDTSGYNYMISANSEKVDPTVYGGLAGPSPCACEEKDPGCKIAKGGKCLVCESDKECSRMSKPVQLGINFFKLHTINLQTSLLAFAAWIRQEWYDDRLWYDYQCYGGVDYFEVQAEPGSIENSVIWAPDIELYNNDEPIWMGSVGARNAQIYSCWSGNPTRGGCGYIFFSRPGVLKALCKYEGIVEFPFDKASCELELAPFGLDGRWQDVIPRKKDGGVAWLTKPNTLAVAGLTAGSKYQDYKIEYITCKRNVVFYDCCPNAPWPDLVYTVSFKRSTSYYVVALLYPGIMLVIVSWITFWMDPAVGERLNYGMIVFLAMIANMVTANSLMPICNEKTVMDYVSIINLWFTALALLETGLVLHLYYLEADSWTEALTPRWFRLMMKSSMYKMVKGERTNMAKQDKASKSYSGKEGVKRSSSVVAEASDTEESLVRKQMYRQIFYVLDDTHNMMLDVEELEEFGQIMTGGHFSKALAMKWLMQIDQNCDGTLDLEEFVWFCDKHLVKTDDILRFKQITQGFLEIMDRKAAARVHMWQTRARVIDRFARYLIPLGYFLFLGLLFTKSRETLEKEMLDVPAQMPLFIIGFVPLFVAVFLYTVYGAFYMLKVKQQQSMILTQSPMLKGLKAPGAVPKAKAKPGDELPAALTGAPAPSVAAELVQVIDTIDVSDSWEVLRTVATPPSNKP